MIFLDTLSATVEAENDFSGLDSILVTFLVNSYELGRLD